MKLLSSLLLLFFFISLSYSQQSIEDYYGMWNVDIEKTIQNSIEGKIKDSEQFPERVINMMKNKDRKAKEFRG